MTLPLLRGPLVAAAGAVLLGVDGELRRPGRLGVPAGFGTMTTRMFQALQRSADPAAFSEAIVLALTLVVLAVIVLAPVATCDPASPPRGPVGPRVPRSTSRAGRRRSSSSL